MNTHADKTQENKSQSVSAVDSQMQSVSESTFQFVDNRPEAVAQRNLQEIANNSPRVMQLKALQDMANISPQAKQAAQLQAMADNSSEQQQPIQKKENNTGLPDNLKAGIENLSGYSLDDVKVHYNSDKPTQLQAHAYAQGTDIHLASGQEKHLPHEAWHVGQQKQGRVKPTMQMKGKVNVNDDVKLEKEADVMGAKALITGVGQAQQAKSKEQPLNNSSSSIQRTTYKIASEGPDFHQTDPEKYSGLMEDELVGQSLHKYKVDEIDLSIATSPITIFIHGSTMAKWTAAELFDFLKKRNYTPQPDSDIVFITCSGATLMDKFLVSKGQALADLLGARVHLAKGTVRINSKGVPTVQNPDSDGIFDYINSKEELRSILQGESEGWQTYAPNNITFDKLVRAIRQGKTQLHEFRQLDVCQEDIDWFRDSYAEIEEELGEDRRYLEERYETVMGIQEQMDSKYLPRLELYKKLRWQIFELDQLSQETVNHKERVLGFKQEFERWMESIKTGKKISVEGYGLLLQDKEEEWIAPLKADIERENEPELQEGEGWEDFDLDLDLEDEIPNEGAGTENAQGSSTGQNTVGKKDVSQLSRAPIQRQINESGQALANGQNLTQIVSSLANIDLVQGQDGIDLEFSFKPMANCYGLTRLKANGAVVVASEYIKPETAFDHYTIEIELNQQFYHDGTDMDSMGSLIETITHEWSLHGEQHAININSARHGLAPDLKIDHERMFSPDMNHMDIGIALQIIKPENAGIAHKIYEAYLNDVVAHQNIEKRGWEGDNLYNGIQLTQELKNFMQQTQYVLSQFERLNENPDNKKPLTQLLGALQSEIEWYVEDDFVYLGLDSIDGIDITEILTKLQQIRGLNLSEMSTMLIQNPMQKIEGLLQDLKGVLEIAGIADPAAARIDALQKLGIDTATFDTMIGAITGNDDQVDFAASEKKTK
jgi:hypothetical protein